MSFAFPPSIAAGLGLATPYSKTLEWGDVATAAKAAGALAPAWKKFIKTKFFVPILRSPDDNPKNFLLHIASPDRHATLTISEVRERLAQQQADGIVALSGAEIVRRLEGKAGIEVALCDSMFSISRKRADWLRSGIEVTKRRIVTRKILLDAAPAAPLPVLHIGPAPAPQDAATSLWSPAARRPAAPVPPPAPRKPAASLQWPVPVLQVRMPVILAVAAIGMLAATVLNSPDTKAPDDIRVASEKRGAPSPPLPANGAAPTLPAAETQVNFVTFTPVDNSFTVSVPGIAEEVALPPVRAREMGDTPTNHYRLQADGLIYTMEVTDYRTLAPNELAAEMVVREELVIGSDGSLIDAMPVTLRGATGRDVRVRLPNGEERAARFVFVGSKFCMVTVTAPSGERYERQVDAFLNSFQLN